MKPFNTKTDIITGALTSGRSLGLIETDKGVAEIRKRQLAIGMAWAKKQPVRIIQFQECVHFCVLKHHESIGDGIVYVSTRMNSFYHNYN